MLWNIEVGDTFVDSDIDLDQLEKHLAEEYRDRYSSYENTRNGLIAEHFLIEKCGYTNDDTPYKDLFNTEGVSVEVKTFGVHRDPDAWMEEVLHGGKHSLRKRKVLWKKDISDHIIFFQRDENRYICYAKWVFGEKDRYTCVHKYETVV